MTGHVVAVFDSDSAVDGRGGRLGPGRHSGAGDQTLQPAAIDSSRERYAGSSTSNGVGFWAGLLGEEPATENHALALPR